MTGDTLDLGDKVRAVREGNGYLTGGASCESYCAHLRYPFVMLWRCLQDVFPDRKSPVVYIGNPDCQEQAQNRTGSKQGKDM